MTHAQPQKKSFFNMNVDLMHGPILKSLLLFMLPILVSNLFQQLYNTVDTMIVGNVLGDTALAAIGSCGSIYELLVGFGIGIGNGLAIVAARSYGAQDEDLLKRTVVGSVVIGLIASLVITTAGFFGLHALLQLLDTPAEILEEAYSYIIVIDLGVVVMFMYNLCAGLLRAIGNSVMPLVFLLISSALNVGLDLWFIAGVGTGVRGAAVATVIAQGISVVLCVLYVLARVRILIPEKKHFAVGSHLYWELFSQSISMGLMSSIVSAGSVVLQYGINGLGTLTIAGHTAARKLFAFTDMPLISMANAGSTFVSQNRGANQPDRVRRGMRQMYLYSVVVMVAAVVLMNFGAQWMVQLISGSSEPIVLENGARYLLWNAPFYAVLGVLLCTRYALQSLGQKVLPLFSSVIELVGTFHMVGDPLVGHQFAAEHSGQGLFGDVVLGGSEPPGDDDDVGISQGAFHAPDDLCAVVADRNLFVYDDAGGVEVLGDGYGVRIHDLADEDFIADGDDCRFHGRMVTDFPQVPAAFAECWRLRGVLSRRFSELLLFLRSPRPAGLPRRRSARGTPL